MITFRVRGRLISVSCSELDPRLTDVELNVVLNHDQQLEAGCIFKLEAGPGSCRWVVHLPAELYQGCARQIALQIKSAGRLLEMRAFSFVGSEQILQPIAGPAVVDANATHFEQKKIDISAYGEAASIALSIDQRAADILFFSIIDWHFRIQRPQHLARSLAEAHHRVFYISVHFGDYAGASRFRIVQQPEPRVFEVQLLVSAKINRIYGGFTADHVEQLRDAVLDLYDTMKLTAPIAIVQFASWCSVAEVLPGCTVVYDCLDLLSGFENVGQQALADEQRLIRSADLLVTTSEPLANRIAPVRASALIRNGATVEHFRSARRKRSGKDQPVVGYFGAIDHWFEASWVRAAAEHNPAVRFKLIGRAEPEIVAALDGLSNVELAGEIAYDKLPEAIRDFSIGIIPFKITPLIECVNPVKLYEYMAAGLPVVASPLPEVVAVGDLVRIAATAEEFATAIQAALEEAADAGAAKRRARWASQHGWSSRADQLRSELGKVWPKVSVIIVAYNKAQFTAAAVHSVLTLSDYENLEVIVVDNASADDTQSVLRQFAEDKRFRMIRLEENAGFAGGNNIGMKAATGDVFILLNNDTFVTKGWVRDLIRPLLLNHTIGLAGPLTNRIGNEQQVQISYDNMSAMAVEARRVTRRYSRRLFEVRSVAFFCVALRRDLYENVGELDEKYGIGFFEDDDYCMRAAKAGYRSVIVDDVFVHHHLSASFADFGDERRRILMERNRKIYEEAWGPWPGHQYRDEPGFGV